MNPEAGEALAEVKKEFVEMLPLPPQGSFERLAKLGSSMISTKAAPSSVIRDRQIRVLAKQIDNAVIEAYGLDSTEAAMVLGNSLNAEKA